MLKQSIEIINKLGLHARASNKFTQTASQFQSEVRVTKNDSRVNGKSIMGLMMLAAAKEYGHRAGNRRRGRGGSDARPDRLNQRLLRRGRIMSIVLPGVAAGKGIAVGCAHLIARGTEEVPQYDVAEADTDAEAERFDAAVKATRKELEQLRSAIPENAPTELGAFISLHLMLLTDVTLSREPVDILREQKSTPSGH